MPLDAHPSELHNNAPIITGPGEKLVKITLALTDLIKRETSFLKAHRNKDAQALHGEKSRLMAEYRDTLNNLQVNEHLLGSKDSRERKYIKSITEPFREALREHARIVLRMKAVTEGLIKSVGEEVSKRNPSVTGYNKTAAFAVPQNQRPTSLSLNQVI
ncbi:hypothetical protein [Kordiimonas sp. SCSIO 12610]|uniref:hypothetical protein n=1 Tax=Kordiimonas sp. SCSIO 12610 TaxID=2829597 RepID=UPI00210952AD|nr:hypothetical protein [Kordiimonas sp. SCSIO 12610]UTW54187.1 hypothetical protein KFF44_10135 [Kordiimonas sp. SCSIO 12610]